MVTTDFSQMSVLTPDWASSQYPCKLQEGATDAPVSFFEGPPWVLFRVPEPL